MRVDFYGLAHPTRARSAIRLVIMHRDTPTVVTAETTVEVAISGAEIAVEEMVVVVAVAEIDNRPPHRPKVTTNAR